ncbi:MAG: hypothetical protein PHG25_03485 [Candidatus Pacebacteria bacterium]|nr:hypothetical protein [Candidatus Paceibacterota bacterium]
MKTTTGIYGTHADAESAIKELRSFGIPDVDISYIYVDNKGTLKDGQSDEKVSSNMGSAATGLVAGGLIGGLVSLGINNADAILYEALVRKGDILVIVRSDAVGTMDVFVKSNAREVREYAAK